MALAATTIWEVRTTGSDTANGGAFDPGQVAGMLTDGAATSANTSAPVFTSASYSFVAGDAGAWLFIASGTNWTPGWYQIASVSGGAATLTATAGSASTWNSTTSAVAVSTATGCATVASPTSATWSIDFSQQASPKLSYTDLASAGAGLTVSSAASPFSKAYVGNGLVVTSGTNFTAGRYVIASVSVANVATVLGAANITTGVGASGVGGLGGALASLGQAGAAWITSNQAFVKSGSYTISSATTNVSGGCLSRTGHVEGYYQTRGDLTPLGVADNRPTLTAGSISTFTMVVGGNVGTVRNLILDGASKTSARGLDVSGHASWVHVKNCTNTGILAGSTSNQCSLWRCSATGCATAGAGITVRFGHASGCVSYSNSVPGFVSTTHASYSWCVSYGNSGASSDGFQAAAMDGLINCVAYGNGRDGFRLTTAIAAVNCIAEGNSAYGFTSTGVGNLFANCAAYNNTSGTTNLAGARSISVGLVTLTASPFTNAASGDFSLNTTAGGGAACRAAGYPGVFPGGLTTGYVDIGAAQHADPAALALYAVE